MKATEANLLKFLRKSPQFVIPIYQRNYSWTEEQCRQLWTDLLRAGRLEKVSVYPSGLPNDWRVLFATVIGVRHVA